MMTNYDMDSVHPARLTSSSASPPCGIRQLGVLAALEQRITLRYQMNGMTPDQTASYIRHHLELAGRTDKLFTDEAMTHIHDAARGLPAPSTTSAPRPDRHRRRREEPRRPRLRQAAIAEVTATD